METNSKGQKSPPSTYVSRESQPQRDSWSIHASLPHLQPYRWGKRQRIHFWVNCPTASFGHYAAFVFFCHMWCRWSAQVRLCSMICMIISQVGCHIIVDGFICG
ncbi:hypothetical protein BDV26DRAFT_149818 [Aspergillus bertholletiae]|uniref:Uncharacterized protein n=1 Tax=Aspergillus bertholletiae TaxID=1226010 RepID=A0A5N7BE18_9EURO|nr:hypothetical protein BDV26DRAFT_149818 [Aspergillus bertholletiae]